MTKYELKSAHVEINLHRKTSLTAEEIFGYHFNQFDQSGRLLGSFGTLEEAKAAFEKEKEHCITRSLGHKLVSADVLMIEENEYDEDGEWVSGGDCWTLFAEPYGADDDEEEEKDE